MEKWIYRKFNENFENLKLKIKIYMKQHSFFMNILKRRVCTEGSSFGRRPRPTQKLDPDPDPKGRGRVGVGVVNNTSFILGVSFLNLNP